MVHWQQIEAARRGDAWDFVPSLRGVRPLLRDALVVANLETVMAGTGRPYSGRPPFNAPDSLAGALAEIGVDVLTLANNHIMDAGPEGARRTKDVAEAAGIRTVGLDRPGYPHAKPLILEHGGFAWAFVNFLDTEVPGRVSSDVCPTMLDETDLAECIREARASADIVVTCFHWGEEYRETPRPRQRRLASAAFHHGADIVIGTHPHVLQPVEVEVTEGGKPRVVAYSLGNFISHQRIPPRERSVVLAIDVEREPSTRSGPGEARIVKVSAAPIYTRTLWKGRHSVEVAPAPAEIRETVADFLGAALEEDDAGFHSIWRTSPQDRRTP